MITLTEEQAQQIEEAFAEAEYLSNSLPVDADKVEAALATIRAARAQEQAEQEPVAYLCPACVDNFATHNYKTCERTDYGAFPTYAAPVRTKDLTDDEIGDLIMPVKPIMEFARAAIAADREKNRG